MPRFQTYRKARCGWIWIIRGHCGHAQELRPINRSSRALWPSIARFGQIDTDARREALRCFGRSDTPTRATAWPSNEPRGSTLKCGSWRTAKHDSGKSGVRFLARSKRGIRFRTASLLGGYSPTHSFFPDILGLLMPNKIRPLGTGPTLRAGSSQGSVTLANDGYLHGCMGYRWKDPLLSAL
jgi:hypothetical protein